MLASQLEKAIIVEGANTHNLKSISTKVPHNTLIVVTGRSGSGKSSFAFDTIFAEGQLIYLESFNTYARQFLGKIERPPVKSIRGLLPSIGMQQKTKNTNPRSRVATSADLYAYLKILYARIGITYSPISGKQVKKHSVEDVVNYLVEQPIGTKALILAPLHQDEKLTWTEVLQVELGKGFTRLIWDEQVHFIQDIIEKQLDKPTSPIYIIVDRIVIQKEQEELAHRIADSVQTAFFEGEGNCMIKILEGQERHFSDRFELDGITFEEPSLAFFTFNNSYGACPRCRGWGRFPDIDPEKVIPNDQLSLLEGAILPFEGIATKIWRENMLYFARKNNIPRDQPYKHLTEQQQNMLWQGVQDDEEPYMGIDGFFEQIEATLYKISHRIIQARYRTFLSCKACQGTGLRPDSHHVKIDGKSLIDLMNMPIDQVALFFNNITLLPQQQKVGQVLLESIRKKLDYLQRVGLGYLILNRKTNTLSGGEYQRLRLAKILGSPLVDALYVLDEPTIGLHPRDTDNLVAVLVDLQQMGNTVIVVEHEETVMRAAGHIIDIGPKSGLEGGNIVFQGNWQDLLKAENSETAAYLTNKKVIPLPEKRRSWQQSINISGIQIHNLKDIKATFPLGIFTVITGVSGSGKSTLVQKVLYPALCHHIHNSIEEKHYRTLNGHIDSIKEIEFFSQATMGTSSRSNIATYLKVYDLIRSLYASQPLAIKKEYMPQTFSFNMEGGRCEACQGDGEVTIDMHFMADVAIPCEECKGKRFKQSVLEVTYQDKNIADILNMTVDESIQFFAQYPQITNRLKAVQQVGLGYMKIGQSSSSFSSGEAQRVKLSTYLIPKQTIKPTFFIFDEPTTGLHFYDIEQLLKAFQALVAQGHTVLVIEHNTEVLKVADWIIDLGPEAGENGGQILFEGTPEKLVQQKNNHTAHYLKPKLKGKHIS